VLDPIHDFYTAPFSLQGLCDLMQTNGHHGRLPAWKAGLMLRYLRPNAIVSYGSLRNAAIDYSALGNCYFEVIRNALGQTLGLRHLPALNMRRMSSGQYCFLQRDPVNPWYFEVKKFPKGKVIHLFEYSPITQVYGIPYWIGAMQSILMGEEARIAQRDIFKNGAYKTNILGLAGIGKEKAEEIGNKIAEKKGIAKLGTLLIDIPTNGDIDKQIKVIPVGDLTKVDLTKIMNQSASDILEAWGIPPRLAGMLPEQSTGSSDLFKEMVMYYEYEIIPFQSVFLTLNNFLPDNAQLVFDNDKIDKFNVLTPQQSNG
jgi:PBSX family phage portal protein